METMKHSKKRKGFDALRGIGIAGIVLYHLFPHIFKGGFLGVPLFFVLSGYLMFITSEASWEKGEFHIRSYYHKRIRKILPPLFTMVMGVCCFLTLTQSTLLTGIRQEMCSIFLGYENWWQIGQKASYFTKLANASPFTHLWFLAVEVQFYLLWPILFFLYQKACRIISGKKMCFVFLFLALLSAGRMFILHIPGGDPSRVYYGTDTMAFPLLIGIFLGAVRQQYKQLCFTIEKQKACLLFVLFVMTIGVLFFTVNGQDNFLYQGGMFLLSLFFAAMINLIANQESSIGRLLDTSILSFIGKKSYGIYLWHYPIIILAPLTYII